MFLPNKLANKLSIITTKFYNYQELKTLKIGYSLCRQETINSLNTFQRQSCCIIVQEHLIN